MRVASGWAGGGGWVGPGLPGRGGPPLTPLFALLLSRIVPAGYVSDLSWVGFDHHTGGCYKPSHDVRIRSVLRTSAPRRSSWAVCPIPISSAAPAH